MIKDKLKKLRTGIEIKPDILENQAKKVYLSIGSNLGRKKFNIEKAIFLLQTSSLVKIRKISSYYKSDSWPDNTMPFFLNIVIEVKTKLNPLDLFKFIKHIEKTLGRKKAPKNYPRKCDIDILDYAQKKIKLSLNNDKIIIPHERLHERNFVLLPLFEISKNWMHSVSGKRIAKLIEALKLDNLRSINIM